MLRSITIIAILIVATIASFLLDRPNKVKPQSSSDFSAERVMNILEGWGDAPHPIGSVQLEKVRDKIVNELTALGLDVKTESGYTSVTWSRSYKRMAQVENIIALLPGDGTSDKTIVLCGHYDSVVEGPGAGDDGYAIASMIETVRLLKAQNRKHNLLLLITDGEERGLLGAKYHMENNEAKDYAVLLNFEARGNEGPGIAFEWSENNYWLVHQVAEAYQKPVANSMSFEVYKLMPNSSDFTVFNKYDIKGINHAFIDGFSYYHHPQDDVHHLSPESVQHTGENMYLAARHFLNTNLDIEHKGNATFFNFYGMFIYYSSFYDKILLVLGLILCFIYVGRLVQKKTLPFGSLIASFFTLLFFTIVCLGLALGLSFGIKYLYPQYATFYSYHYYNHEWYLLAGVGLILFVGMQSSSFVGKKWGIESLRVSVLLLLALFSVALFIYLKTGAYLMIIPLISTALAFLSTREKSSSHTLGMVVSLLALLFIIGLWVFLSHSLYLAFSIFILAGAVLPSLLFVYVLSGLFFEDPFSFKLPLSILGIGLFVTAMFMAHLQSTPSKEKPLLIDMTMYHHTDTNKSYLASKDAHLYFAHPEGMAKAEEETWEDYRSSMLFVKDLPNVNFSTLESQIDTLYADSSAVRYKLTNPKRAEYVRVMLDEVSNVDSFFIDGVLNKNFKSTDNSSYFSVLYGIAQDSAEFRIVKRDMSKPIQLEVQNIYHGFAEDIPIPANAIWKHPNTRIIYRLEF